MNIVTSPSVPARPDLRSTDLQASSHTFGRSSRHSANDPIAGYFEHRVIELRAAWQFVGAAHQRFNPHCEDCGFNDRFEGAPGEQLCECTLGRRGEMPGQCPAYRDAFAGSDA